MKILRYFLLVIVCILFPKNYIRGLCKAENEKRTDGVFPLTSTFFDEIKDSIENRINKEWNQKSEKNNERTFTREIMERIHLFFMDYFHNWEDAYSPLQEKLEKCTSRLKAVKIKLSIREMLQKMNKAIISPILNDVPGLSFSDKWEISISLRMTAYGRKAYHVITSGDFDMKIPDFAVAITEISDMLSNITHRGTALNEANMEWSDIQNVLGKPRKNQDILEKIFVVLHHIWTGVDDEATLEITTPEPRGSEYGYIIIREIEPSVLESDVKNLCTAVAVSADQYIFKTATNSPRSKILIIKHPDVEKVWQKLDENNCVYTTMKKAKGQLKVDIQKPIVPITD